MATFSKREALNFGWETFKKNAGFLISVTLAAGLVYYIPGIVIGMFSDQDPSTYDSVTTVISLILWPIQMLVGMGLMKISLKFVDGQKPEFADLISQGPRLVNYIIATIIYTLVVSLGIIALVIPGIYLALMFYMYSYIIVDKGVGPIDSLKQSSAMTKGNRLNLLLFALLSFLVVLGGVILLFVGIFIAAPVVMIASAYIYRKLSGGVTSTPAEVPAKTLQSQTPQQSVKTQSQPVQQPQPTKS